MHGGSETRMTNPNNPNNPADSTPESLAGLIQGPALQSIWTQGTCYGCGPANPHGLQLKSYWSVAADEVLCAFSPQPYHNAGFENVMYGGLIACLCDCHSIWTAIAYTYQAEGRQHGEAPSISYVTGQLSVRYLAPTPLDAPVILRARCERIEGRKAHITCGLYAGGNRTVTATVLAVRIAEDKAVGTGHHHESN